jgi:beta-glucosidase
VEISLPTSRLAYWDVKMQSFRVEPGTIGLMVGDSSAHIALNGTVQVQ